MKIRSYLTFFGIGAFVSINEMRSQDWESPLPAGAENDLVALNVAFGNQRGADYIKANSNEALRTETKPFKFDGIKPKDAAVEAILRVKAAELPPMMLGSGSFYLIKIGATHYPLTKRNFVRLFAPIETAAEVLPYVTAYERLFGNRFAEVITKEKEQAARDAEAKAAKAREAEARVPEAKVTQQRRPPVSVHRSPPPSPVRNAISRRGPAPATTTIEEKKDGFEVRLIVYNEVVHRYYAEKRLFVRCDGTVEERKKQKIVKDIGPGLMVD